MIDGPPEADPSNQPHCPNISQFLIELGVEKNQVIQNMHWMTMTGMIGSIGSYVKTIESPEKSDCIKKRLKSATMEKKANTIASRLGAERAVDRPTPEGVVDKGVKSHTKQMGSRM